MAKSASTKPAGTAEGRETRELGRRWMNRIEAAGKLEKPWMDDAERAVTAYTGEQGRQDTTNAGAGIAYDFNIAYANVETIVPAIINSPPAPDVRRRFGSADPVARDVAEIIERAIRIQVDDSKLQVELEAMAQDAFLAGRGVIRLRFKSEFENGETTREELAQRLEEQKPGGGEADADRPGEISSEIMKGEHIAFEAVTWRDYRHGPAKRWEDRPWEAFRHAMTPEDCDEFADSGLVASQLAEGDAPDSDEDKDHIVWEVWEKKTRTVYFVRDGDGMVLKKVEDPLGLSGFFSIATPVQAIEVTGRLMPVNPFSIYSKLADELDTTTKRIRVITKQLKVKGFYGISSTDLQAVLDLDDNEFAPISDAEIWTKAGGLQNAVVFWPIEKLAAVLLELYRERDQTKQAIYEITGISDIVRGASMASETATAQNIKSQWGSLRIQKMQRMIERAARDLFVMMAEVIPAKFSYQTLQQMTEVQILPSEQDQQPVVAQTNPNMPPEAVQQARQQAQAKEAERAERLQHLMAMQALMRQKLPSFYRIDVESDSTVKADLTRQKAEASEFMNAASGYFGAVAPLVQQGALPMEVAVEIFSSFSRMFNLGKSVEDALDGLIELAKERAEQPPKPDPAQAAAEAEQRRKQEEADLKKAETQSRIRNAGVEASIKRQQAQAKIQAEAEERAHRMQIEMMEAQAEATRAQQAAAEKNLDLRIKTVDLQIKEAQLARVQMGGSLIHG